MERSSKLADLKLVSKYYPVANYSYPRADQPSSQSSRSSNDRASLGSEGSAPGLIDDRTDSEVSLDDDYQYHTHATELWDSFWLPANTEEKEPRVDLHPAKQYPALIPSPQHRKKREQELCRNQASWPLPESPKPRNRKPAAAYSPFPKPILLPPRSSSLVPSWQPSRPNGKPQRPPRPDALILPPCVQPLPVTAHFATSPEAHKTSFPRPVTPITPITPNTPEQRPSTPMDARPATPADTRCSIRTVTSHSTLRPSSLKDSGPPAPSRLSNKPIGLCHLEKPGQELHSVFEYDDSDLEEESHGRSFFRFHKRSDSDTRRTAKSCEPPRGRRARASTAPSSPSRNQPERTSKQHDARKRQGDVFGRMLGRRSR